MFIDTHCHLNMMVKKEVDSLLSDDHYIHIESLVEQAVGANVTKIVNVGTSVNESINSINIANRFENVFATVGIHPCDANSSWKDEFAQIQKLAKSDKVVAIGETGLDFYHKPFNKERQIDSFKAHIELSLKLELPLVVHVRNAADETLRVLEEYASEARGVNHCFQQDKYFADQMIEWGFYLGIDAPITYPKNNEFRDMVSKLPLESMILETDSPFLPPQEYRGRQNHPKYIPLFAKLLAELKGVSLDELAKVTTSNAEKLFSI